MSDTELLNPHESDNQPCPPPSWTEPAKDECTGPILHSYAVSSRAGADHGVWAERGGGLNPHGVSRWLPALPSSPHWLASTLKPPPPLLLPPPPLSPTARGFDDMFAKHKQLGLCSGNGRLVYCGRAAVCKRQVEECRDGRRRGGRRV